MHLHNNQEVGDCSEHTFRQVDRYEVFRDVDSCYSDTQQLAHIVVLGPPLNQATLDNHQNRGVV
jgi:hypothetical protein